MWTWRPWTTCSCAWFGVFRRSFPKLPQHLSTCETGIARPTEVPDTRVRSHLMWNKELNTLDHVYVSLHMIWGIRPNFPKLPQYPSTCETGIARPAEGPDTRVRSHLMWNKELKTLDYFSCVPAHDLGYSGPFPPSCPNTKLLKKTGITQSSDDLGKSKKSFDVKCGAEDYGLL